MISGFVREFEKLLGPSSVLYRSRIWRAGRARPHRARLSPLLACQRRAQLCFPAPAPRSPSHHRRRTRFAFLSTLRFAGHRAQYWCLETSWCGRARTSPPAHRRLFFLSLPRLDVSCRRSSPRPRCLFSGCVANVTFSQRNAATVRVLAANGCEVVIPKDQLFCGALAAHARVRDGARDLARKNLSTFLRKDFDAIITNAAGCGSMLKEYDHLFSTDEAEHTPARQFAAKTRDVTEFLAALGLTAKLKSLPLRVTYQDSCHLLHGQQIREAPRILLRAIPDLEFVELPYSEICCGSAGVYNGTQTETSLELLAEKTSNPLVPKPSSPPTQAACCSSASASTSTIPLHVVELLDRAIASAPAQK